MIRAGTKIIDRVFRSSTFALLGFVSVSTLALQAHASEIYQIRTVTDDGEIHCTSTLLKLDSGKCSLVTNYHCVPTDETQQVFFVSASVPANFVSAPSPDVEVQVLKRSAALDLAELSLPPQAQTDCSSMGVSMVTSEDQILAMKEIDLRTEGFVNGAYTDNFSDDLPWNGGSSYSDVLLYRHGSLPSEIFYQLDRLNVIPGMSGGVVTERSGAIVGLNSQLIPFQKVAFVIPIQEVVNFLQNGGPDSATSTTPATMMADGRAASGVAYVSAPEGAAESNSHVDSGANSHGNGGANSHGNGGANSHGNGGANSHGNGGANSHGNGGANSHGNGGGNSHGDGGVGIEDTSYNPQDPLYLFREPDEGVPIAPGSSTILLGIDGKQIDGLDDYYIKYMPVKDQGKHTLVTRDANDYPSEDIRKGILSRLEGMFKGGGGDVSFQSNNHSVMIFDPKSPEGFTEFFTGNTSNEVDVDSKNNQIHMYFWMHQIGNPGLPAMLNQSAWILDLDVTMSPDYKTITLKAEGSNGPPLTCDNRNYLKLVCRAPGTEFSISENQAQGPDKQMSYRVAYVRQDKVVSVDYRYGQMIQESDKTRKFAKEMAKQEKGIIAINE